MNLKPNHNKLTPFKLISGIISVFVIIGLCIYLIITSENSWHYYVLIALALFFLCSIIISFQKEQKEHKGQKEK
jgi:L-asparagine transporter-like permease